MEIPLIGKIILYIIIVLFGIMCIILCGWQLMVLRGKSMKNPDGSVDDWHKQKLFYGSTHWNNINISGMEDRPLS